ERGALPLEGIRGERQLGKQGLDVHAGEGRTALGAPVEPVERLLLDPGAELAHPQPEALLLARDRAEREPALVEGRGQGRGGGAAARNGSKEPRFDDLAEVQEDARSRGLASVLGRESCPRAREEAP